MADRDPGAGKLGGGGAAHLADAFLQGVHGGTHVRKAAAIGVERDPRAAGPTGRSEDAGGGVALGDEGSGLAARHKAEVFEAVDRQVRESFVDHQMIDVAVRDAGLGKGLGGRRREMRTKS